LLSSIVDYQFDNMVEKAISFGGTGALIGAIVMGVSGCNGCFKKCWDYYYPDNAGITLGHYFNGIWNGIVVGAIIGALIGVIFGWNEFMENSRREEEERKAQEQKRKEQEEKLIREKEIERRKNIVLDIVNNLYKNTEREVNKTLIPTLINELYDIYIGLHSDNLNDLIKGGSLSDFQNIINSIKLELERLKKLAITAQARGYSDEIREDVEMTDGKAFEILGIKKTATKEEIKNAHRNLVKKYHTDLNNRDKLEDHIKQMLEDKMKEINNAKDYLSKLGLI